MRKYIPRREFIRLIGGAGVWPLVVHAEQGAMPVIGFLYAGSLEASTHLVAAFREGLREKAYIEGENVAVEYRFAHGQLNRLPELAADLVRRPATVIATDVSAAFAVKAATTTVPIIFATGGDPLGEGLVSSLNRPGGNITGVSFLSSALGAKQLDLLRQLVPKAAVIAALVNPNYPNAEVQLRHLQEAAHKLGLRIQVMKASNEREIDAAFASLVQQRADALVSGGGAFFFGQRSQIVALAARYAIPAIYPPREFPAAGGLMSYGASITDAYHQIGVYAGRILKGEKPGDLPVMQPTKFELVINLKTARTLGLEVPATLLAIADEVIE